MGFVTAEKISPSPISILADIQKAVELEKKLGRGKIALRDVLGRVVSDFNKMNANKKHRIDSGRKALLLNMLLGKDYFPKFYCTTWHCFFSLDWKIQVFAET